jgi:uncharacterized membrane protein HdeD (DUF308 family)
MIGDEIKGLYHDTKWALIVRGALSVIVGIAIIARPMESVAALALVIALWSLFDGTVNIVRSFHVRGVAPHWWILLLSGIVGVLFGATALYYFPGLSLAFAVIWTAYWLTFSGVMAVYAAFMERRVGLSWGWTMAFGLVAIVGGLFAFLEPAATLATLIGLIAAFAIISGLVLLMGAGRMQSLQRDLRNARPAPAKV